MNKKLLEAVGKDGWMPFYWGNKVRKRLTRKRIRVKEKKDMYSMHEGSTNE